MRCLEPEAVARDIIQELAFLARENLRVKTFYMRARRMVDNCGAQSSGPELVQVFDNIAD